MEVLPLAGYQVCSTTAAELCSVLEHRLNLAKKTALLFVNTNFTLQCQPLRPWLSTDQVILVNDGIGMDVAAKLIHGRTYAENLNGTDFIPLLFKRLAVRRKVFLLGGRPGVAVKAAQAISKLGQQVVGCQHGYSQLNSAELCSAINLSGAEIVLVAMGNPVQENWINANAETLDATLCIGVGALLDFLAGGVRRAPLWVQRIRCEWLFRLCQEPRRLLKRYTSDLVLFLSLCLKKRN